jgi:LemA protein
LQLQGRISGLENEIADRREFFNESVNVYNIRIQQMPDLFVANSMGYTRRSLLEIPKEETTDVKIQF